MPADGFVRPEYEVMYYSNGGLPYGMPMDFTSKPASNLPIFLIERIVVLAELQLRTLTAENGMVEISRESNDARCRIL